VQSSNKSKLSAPSIASELRKFYAFVAIYWQDTLAYGSTSIIWILADGLLAMLMPAVWLSAYSGRETIFGMSPGDMVTYYLATLIMSQFIISHLLWDIGYEIREGVFTTQLLRPYSIFWMNFARNLAWRSIKTVMFVPFAVAFCLVYWGHLGATALSFSAAFVLSLVLAHVLSYMMAYTLALTAMWTTEYQSVFSLYYFPETFFSGRFFPLAALPVSVLAISDWLPFKYTVAFPAEMLLGKLSAQDVAFGLAAQALWISGFAVLGAIVFRVATKRYTGFGN